MRMIAVLNRDGGTFRAIDLEAFADRARLLAGEHGVDLECRIVAGGDLIEELKRAVATADADVVMAGGGDGTISAAAGICFRAGKPLAVLPAGTMNFFARTLRVPLDLEEAVRAIAGGRLHEVDIATANGRPFIHQFSVGLHARFVRMRETIHYANRWEKMLATLRAIGAAVAKRLKFQVELRVPDGRMRRLASGVAVSNNVLAEGHMPHADVCDGGVLGVYVAKPMTALGAARLCVSVLLGHWKGYPGVSEDRVTEVTLTFPSRKRTAQAVVDGELIPLEDVVEIKIHPRALRVLAPAALQVAPIDRLEGETIPAAAQ